MVFLVRLPARSAQNSPQVAGSSAGAHAAGAGQPAERLVTPPGNDEPRAAPPIGGAIPGAVGGPVNVPIQAPTTPDDLAKEAPAAPMKTEEADAPEPPRHATVPHLDVLLDPSVLYHRYVRGVDKSMIVERPERIRAVLLGVAAALGLCEHEHPSHDPDGTKTPVTPDTDDLSDMLSRLSMQRNEAYPIRVLTVARALSLDEPCEAVRLVHASSDEPATYGTVSAYAAARRKRDDASDAAPEPSISLAHAVRMSHIAAQAPNEPPGARAARRGAPPVSTPGIAENTSDATSSDGEGDERTYLSEVPEDLPQGDLYLCGPHAAALRDVEDGGSREAICHALGAAAEGVDRVVAATRGERMQAHQVHPIRATQHNAMAPPPPPKSVHMHTELPASRAFVLCRPPGHHCTGAMPSGFCWVNNVSVAAAHAYYTHGIDRVIVLDIDLHHGNGTQALAWRINAAAATADSDRDARLAAARGRSPRTPHRGVGAATRSATRAENAKAPLEQLEEDEKLAGRRSLRMFYGSLHDIESFPCEDGDPELVRNASVCLEGAHGQWIYNVHLEEHPDDTAFERAYTTKYAQLFDKARRFVRDTHALAPRTLVFISSGFDACTHEYPGMQRHGKHVPPAFYARFARDASALADEVADGKLVSVLEGGYSDRALTSAALSLVGGLAGQPWAGAPDAAPALHPGPIPPWGPESLVQLERMSKRVSASGGGTGASAHRRRQTHYPMWLVRASEHFAAFQRACGVDARPLELLASGPSTPRSAPRTATRGLDMGSETPTHARLGGHALRDRTLLHSKSQSSLAERARAQGQDRTRTPRRTAETPRASRSPRKSSTPARPKASADDARPPVPPVPSPKAEGDDSTASDPAGLVPGALAVETPGRPAPPARDAAAPEAHGPRTPPGSAVRVGMPPTPSEAPQTPVRAETPTPAPAAPALDLYGDENKLVDQLAQMQIRPEPRSQAPGAAGQAGGSKHPV